MTSAKMERQFLKHPGVNTVVELMWTGSVEDQLPSVVQRDSYILCLCDLPSQKRGNELKYSGGEDFVIV